MRTISTILLIIGISLSGLAQETIYSSITHDDLQRDYILYVPENYSGDTMVPLLLNFHGFGSNGAQQLLYGDFRSIADTAGFLVVHPEGTLFQGSQHWNVGGFTSGSTVDDVGFTAALIDSLAAEYNIDPARIYSTGMSNGGYMSFLLACQLGDRIAAIGPVAGSMTPETFDECSPTHATPVLQIHGTADGTVPYDGESWTEPIEEALQYWVDYDNCEEVPTITDVEDINPSDGSTVEHIVYHGGDNGTTVAHFKVIGGGHTWPGSIIPLPNTNYDINASEEVWRFVSRYDIDGLIGSTGIEQTSSLPPGDYKLYQNYPNPFNPGTTIDFKIPHKGHVSLTVFNISGQKIVTLVNSELLAGSHSVNWVANDLSAGVYIYRLEAGGFSQSNKLILLK